MVKKKKAFIGTIILRTKGKVFGATTRQINALDKRGARRELKRRFAFPKSTVTISKLKQIKK